MFSNGVGKMLKKKLNQKKLKEVTKFVTEIGIQMSLCIG